MIVAVDLRRGVIGQSPGGFGTRPNLCGPGEHGQARRACHLRPAVCFTRRSATGSVKSNVLPRPGVLWAVKEMADPEAA